MREVSVPNTLAHVRFAANRIRADQLEPPGFGSVYDELACGDMGCHREAVAPKVHFGSLLREVPLRCDRFANSSR